MESTGFTPPLRPRRLGYPQPAAPSERRRLDALRRGWALIPQSTALHRQGEQAEGTKSTYDGTLRRPVGKNFGLGEPPGGGSRARALGAHAHVVTLVEKVVPS